MLRAVPVEGFLSHPVSGEKQPLLRFVPERNGEHAVEAMQSVITPLLVAVNNNFSIALSFKSMPRIHQFRSQFAEVINFAVKDDDDGPVFVADRLLAASDV